MGKVPMSGAESDSPCPFRGIRDDPPLFSSQPPATVPPEAPYWRFYVSSKYAFSLPYPDDWSIAMEDVPVENGDAPWIEGVVLVGGTPPHDYCCIHVSLRNSSVADGNWHSADGTPVRLVDYGDVPSILREYALSSFHACSILHERPLTWAGLEGSLLVYRHRGLKKLTDPLGSPVVEYSALLWGSGVTYNIIIECSESRLHSSYGQLQHMLEHLHLSPARPGAHGEASEHRSQDQPRSATPDSGSLSDRAECVYGGGGMKMSWWKKLFTRTPAEGGNTAHLKVSKEAGVITMEGSVEALSMDLDNANREFGEMYYQCPKCRYSIRINDVGKMMLKADVQVFRSQFGDRQCKRCGHRFTAHEQVMSGSCPDFDYETETQR